MRRKLVFAASLMIIVVGMLGVASDLHVGYASPYIDVDVDTAYNMITNGSYPNLMVLDVRSQNEYDSGHIYGAVWIPHTELEARISELAGHEDHEIIVYCRSGVRSVNASKTLDSFNFTKVYNMLGGILAWESGGYPVWIATVHNLNTTFNYDTIQAAIDAPQTLYGHTIFVEEGNYYEHVVVAKSLSLIGENRSTTIIDGNSTGRVVRITASNVKITGFTMQNSGFEQYGIQVVHSSDNNISFNIITNNHCGIWLEVSSNNNISGNNMTNNKDYGVELHSFSNDNIFSRNNVIGNSVGVWLCTAFNNTFSGNNIANNNYSVLLVSTLQPPSKNKFYHNNFIDNTQQVPITTFGYGNFWDYGVEGNYWSDYTGVDLNHNGIGDSPYVIDTNNQDNHPLVGMFSDFNTSLDYYVNVISNSTVEDFQYFESNSTIKMYVSGLDGFGFCRVSIPHVLMNISNISVIIDDGLTPVLYHNYTLHDDGTHRWIYFAYEHSTHEVDIIPDFPSFLILPLFMITTLIAVIVYKRKYQTWNKKREV